MPIIQNVPLYHIAVPLQTTNVAVCFLWPFILCDNYRVSGALEKLEHETNLQDRAADR